MRLNFQTLKSTFSLDKTGVAVSWVCAVHCLAMPFLVSFLPLLGISFLAHEAVEYVIIGISTVIALVTLLPGYFRQHRKIRSLLLFVSGICFVIFADKLYENSLPKKMIFVVIGAILITSAHYINRKLCRNCHDCGEIHSRSSA